MPGILDLFWIFVVIVTLTPLISQQMQAAARVRQIRKIERARRSRLITLIHRQESISLLGVPISRFIDIDDSEAVLRAIRLTQPDVPIDIVVHTPGGLVLAAEQIAQALIRHRGKVTVFVPHYAMSGGTLIALAAGWWICGPRVRSCCSRRSRRRRGSICCASWERRPSGGSSSACWRSWRCGW